MTGCIHYTTLSFPYPFKLSRQYKTVPMQNIPDRLVLTAAVND